MAKKSKDEETETTTETAQEAAQESSTANEPVGSKPFIVVAAFASKSDTAHFHAGQVKAHLSHLGVEAQIVPTLTSEGAEMHLLVDASNALGSVTE